MKKLTLETERLLIRNLKTTDIQDFYSYRSIQEVCKYQGFEIMTLFEAEQFILEQESKYFGVAGEWVQYGIIDKKTKKLIGDCAIKLDLFDTRIAEIGITISPTEQQKGMAKETLIAIINHLFSIPNFHRIVETVDAENIASIKLLKSIGFRQEGYFIENIFFKGKWGSEYQFAMLRNEWEINRKNS